MIPSFLVVGFFSFISFARLMLAFRLQVRSSFVTHSLTQSVDSNVEQTVVPLRTYLHVFTILPICDFILSVSLDLIAAAADALSAAKVTLRILCPADRSRSEQSNGSSVGALALLASLFFRHLESKTAIFFTPLSALVFRFPLASLRAPASSPDARHLTVLLSSAPLLSSV